MEFTGATFDSREVKPGMLFVALKGEKCDGRAFIPQALAKGAAGVIEGYEALDRAAREYRRSLKAKVIGITGSAGKTTTKELVRAFLARVGKTHATAGNFNNHIGLPITILNCPKDADFLVLEMGSNHPGEIAHLCDVAEPDCGLITSIGTAHIEFFKTREGIAKEKRTLLERARDFGVEEAPRLDWLADALAAVLPGEHNVMNASKAFALASRFGVTREDALAALAAFALPGSRWRRVEKAGVIFIDDTYNANPDSMIAALGTFAALPCAGRRIAVLGDMFELGGDAKAYHDKVFDFAATLGLDAVFAVGAMSSTCRAARSFATAEELKPLAPELFAAGDTVLLKASHSMHLGSIID